MAAVTKKIKRYGYRTINSASAESFGLEMRFARSKLCYLFSPFVLINIFIFVRFSHKQWKGSIFKATSRMNLSMIQNITIVSYKPVLLRSAVPAKNCRRPRGLGNISVNVTSAEANYWKESDIQAPNVTANGTSSFLGIYNGDNDTVAANGIAIFQPTDCKNSHTVAIIVPFRYRESHLRILLGHLVPILRQQLLRYSIFVMEQVGDATFNKGRLMNTGFEFASAIGWQFGVPYDCFIFQDVDLLVEHISSLYRCQKGVVTHLSTTIDKFNYKPLCCGMTVGGVVGFGEKQFRKNISDNDVLVKWDNGGSYNTVAVKDLRAENDETVFERVEGTRIKMWWEPDQRWWAGSLSNDMNESVYANLSCPTVTEADLATSGSEDDIPLSRLRRVKASQAKEDQENETESPCSFNSPYDSDDSVLDPDYQPSPTRESSNTCFDEVGAFYDVVADEQHSISNLSDENARELFPPESFNVEGEPRMQITIPTPEKAKNARVVAKIRRNRGDTYVSSYNKKEVPTRRKLGTRCHSRRCKERNLHCDEFSEQERELILKAYYDLGCLQKQREWICSHITEKTPLQCRGRKGRTTSYCLPKMIDKMKVCRIMFLSTVGISERQIRKAFLKKNEFGVLEKELRGGRCIIQSVRDANLRQMIVHHINRFPRMESHFCRAQTTQQFLSPDLTLGKMYGMFKMQLTPGIDVPSFSLYYRVFKSLNLKFHVPKKDLCGLCETYHNGIQEKRMELRDAFERHDSEKNRARDLKNVAKARSTESADVVTASFDLQQVIYLPQSRRSEIFYKRRLSCYNFTVFELATKIGHCYFWHEGIAKRGANEMASHVRDFVKTVDSRGARELICLPTAVLVKTKFHYAIHASLVC